MEENIKNNNTNKLREKIILVAQVLSISLIWIFVIGIAIWIFNLISISLDLQDAPGASIGISMIAIPVFFTLAIILTYVFVGFHKKENKVINKTSGESE